MSRPKTERPEKYTVALDEQCPRCYIIMRNHPKCNACGILCGIGHKNALCEYRGKKLCSYCVGAWRRLERLIGREAKWGEFLRPDPLVRRGEL